MPLSTPRPRTRARRATTPITNGQVQQFVAELNALPPAPLPDPAFAATFANLPLEALVGPFQPAMGALHPGPGRAPRGRPLGGPLEATYMGMDMPRPSPSPNHPPPIRITAMQRVSNVMLQEEAARGNTGLRVHIEDALKRVFGEHLVSALAVHGTCIIGRVHTESTPQWDVAPEEGDHAPLIDIDSTVFTQWCYIWPIPVPVEGTVPPELRITHGWFV